MYQREPLIGPGESFTKEITKIGTWDRFRDIEYPYKCCSPSYWKLLDEPNVY